MGAGVHGRETSGASRLELTAAPDPSRLPRVRRRIRDYLGYHCTSADDIDDVVLAIDEACANAICHGRCEEDLQISLAFEGDAVQVRVRDHGVGFDVDHLDRTHMPDTTKTGGRGLYLMQQLVDVLQLTTRDGTEVVMRKRLSGVRSLEPGALWGTGELTGPPGGLLDMFDELGDGFVAVDWEWRVAFVNRKALDLLGLRKEDVVGAGIWEATPYGRHHEDAERELRRVMEQGETSRFETYLSAWERWFDVRAYPASFGLVVYFSEATDRKRMEQEREQLLAALDEERRRLGFVMEQSAAGLAYLDPEFRILRVNARFVTYTGRAREELLGRDLFAVMPGDDASPFFEQVKRGGKRLDLSAIPYVFALQPWRGTMYYDWSLAPLHTPAGELRGFVLSLIDVTATTVAGRFHAALDRINAALSSLLDSSRILDVITELAGEAMGCEASAVALRRAGHWEPVSAWHMPAALMRPYRVAEARHAEEAVREGRPVVVSDEGERRPGSQASRRRTALVVPLTVPDDTEGVLSFSYFTKRHVFSDAETDFAMRCREAVSSALHNARLYEAERRSSSVLHGVLRLSPLLQGAGSVGEVADEVCARARELFECDGAGFYAVTGDELRLLACAPELPALPIGSRHKLTEVAGLEEDLLTQGPSFIEDALAAAPSPSWRAVIDGLPLRSVLRVPVGIGRRPVGLVVLGWAEHRPQPGEEVMVAAKRLADQAGMAWENAERRETQAEAARLHDRLEASLLPRLPLRHPTLEVAAAYRPGEARLRLGGDFFDVLPCNQGELAVLVGDVCGHGPDAAALGATIRGNWRALNLSGAGLQTLLNTLESVLVLERWAEDVYVTMVGGWIDPAAGRFRFVNAGHPPPVLITPGDVRQVAVPAELPLGLREGPKPWTAHEVQLPQDWALLLYTDGLVEGRAAPGATERFGVERLLELAAAAAAEDGADQADLGALPQDLLHQAEHAHGRALPDDAAALLVRPRI